MATRKPELVLPKIHTLRKQKVVLDSELAVLYGVLTKRLNEAVRRNAGRFSADVCFLIAREAFANLKSQIGTSSSDHVGARKRHTAFTEHGALMATTILRSPQPFLAAQDEPAEPPKRKIGFHAGNR